MEIKIQCDCGQKFKFDVEPVHGRMPFTVNCPVCGVDGTARANVLLQQLLPPQPISSVAPPPAPAPVLAPAPAPMRPAGLSINRSHAPQPAPAPVAQAKDDAEAEDDDSSESGGVRVVNLGWKGWAIIIGLIALAVFGSYLKSAQRSLVHDALDWVVAKVTGKSVDKERTTDSTAVPIATAPENVLPDDDGTIVLVKHPDPAAVAQACVEFYAQHHKQKLFSKVVTQDDDVEGLFLIHPVDGDYVQMDGSMFWEEKDIANLTALTEFLAKKFSARCICALMGDDAETGVVAIYENGERKFRCDRNMRMRGGDLVDDVKLEGQAWATGLGFKPGEAGWKGFTMYDADDLAQHVGFKPVKTLVQGGLVLSTKPLKP